MKKIFGILTALLVAVAGLTITSCATPNSDLPMGEAPATAVQGSFGTLDLEKVSPGVVKASFTYDKTMTGWDGDTSKGLVYFKVHSNAEKNDYKYGCDDIAIGSLPSDVENAGKKGADAGLKGLVIGKKYVLSFDTIPTLTLNVTIEE